MPPSNSSATTISASPRILIVRLSAIGDTIHSLPLAAALKRAYPDCHLGWVVEKPSAPLIVNNPLVDWVRVLPKGWLKSPSQVRRLHGDLTEQRFRIAFDIQGLTKSAVAARLSGARLRIGFVRGEAREVAPLLDNHLIQPEGRHAVDMTLSLLRGVNLPVPERGEFVLPPCGETDLAAIDAALAAERYQGGFALFGPWGSFPAKLWPLERFRELAERLFTETGLPSLMLGHGENERGQVEALARQSSETLAAAPDVSLTGVAELARRARVFVGCDSFPMHAAAAVGCRTLGLFGVTDPERLGPYGPNGRSVYEKITLLRSTRKRRRLGPENMLGLTVDKVLTAARGTPHSLLTSFIDSITCLTKPLYRSTI